IFMNLHVYTITATYTLYLHDALPIYEITEQYLTLGVLGRLTGLLQASLLALHRTIVAREIPGLLQCRTVVLLVDRVQRAGNTQRSEEHTSELQSRFELVCRRLLVKKK